MKKLLLIFVLAIASLLPVTVIGLQTNTVAMATDTANFDATVAGNNADANANNMVFTARSAYLTDYETGLVMFEKNAEEKFPIASMVKIMVLNLTFEAIDAGKLSFSQKVTVSPEAQKMGGSQLFIEAGDEYTVSDLIKGVVICSANDAAAALGETISGSIEGFVSTMNARAREYGMANTVFINATGLPGAGQHSTAHDVNIMTRKLLAHKEYYNYSKIYMENYKHPDGRVTELVNTNKLVRFFNGCDSGKTGYTADAKYCLSASAMRNNLRVVATVIGVDDSKTRFAEVTKLFNYGFSNYQSEKLVTAGQVVTKDFAVTNGKAKTVPVIAKGSVSVLSKKGSKPTFTTEVNLPANVRAPFNANTTLGELIVRGVNGEVLGRTELITANDVQKRTYGDAINDILGNWILGK